MNTVKKKPAKVRHNPIKVYVNDSDHTELVLRSQNAGMSLSTYLRVLGLNYRPKSRFDKETILTLVKLHADQGRLGGLLKLWLSSKPNQGASAHEVRELFQSIMNLQQQLNQLVQSL